MKYIMRVIRVVIAVAMVMLTTSIAQAKVKVVESSEKRSPEWVNSSQSDYIITMSIRGDLESAKEECLRSVRDQIINSVAQNVITSNSNLMAQKTENGVTEMVDSFVSKSESQSANMPFLTGISASRIEASYWEKRYDSDTRETTYLYSIKYPFSNEELRGMIAEFEARDSKMEGRYKELNESYNNITSIVDVDNAVKELETLESYFFDDVRQKAASGLLDKYKRVYRSVTIRELSNELGEYKFEFVYNGRAIDVNSKPRVSSKYLSEMR